ncbi:VOC family protein [Yinghuangia soli]|uniref:VOC family protein n=1 Tax=Yinghuangia soli TaxID=2908204 RepID=A0AA41TYJ0_9ACTN|nr:VOC family protein [Yinghuangia soli]MCF2527863.1 VOC family protein [Yinghuangia soli]
MINPPVFPPGTPNWIDLGSPDIPASTAFYTAVFDWSFQDLGPEAGGYGFFQIDGKTVAALGPLTEEGASSAWTIYFATPSADDTAKSAEQAGGTVRVPAFDVFDAGRMACLTDPHGAQFATWQAGTTTGVDIACQPNTFLWAELHTSDPEGAFAFYRTLYKWREQVMEVPGMAYRVVSTAEGDIEDASFGGLAPHMEEGEPNRWVPYFMVEDPDDISVRVAAAGGTVKMAAADMPDVGRMAWYADPTGAEFAVLRPEPPAPR